MLILYAIITETSSRGPVFIAALLPGLMAVVFYIVTDRVIVTLPQSSRSTSLRPRSDWSARLDEACGPDSAVSRTLFSCPSDIGRIYGGHLTPTRGWRLSGWHSGLSLVLASALRF